MAHGNCESMRSRAFTKGRSAFDSDDEYRRALNGEFDEVRKDSPREAGEGPGDGGDGGKDAGNLENPSDEEAVRAELVDLEGRIGETKFLEILERFMKDCSGRGEPPYLPFPPIQDKEVLAIFRDGSGGLRLRYGAYGFEVDRLEGDEVVKTRKGIDEVEILNDWDDALAEMAERDEGDDWNENDHKRQFFEDLPTVLDDRKRGAEFLGFVTNAVNGKLAAAASFRLAAGNGPWLMWTGGTFVLRERTARDIASWEKEEFLEELREIAWDDADARESMLGGELGEAWEALDDAWYDEDEDNLVANSVGKFLADVEDAKKDLRASLVTRTTAVCDESDTGREEMKMVWGRTYPDTAELTFTRNGKEKTFGGVPLAFLRWWAFGRMGMRW